jgi:hypothetical protein
MGWILERWLSGRNRSGLNLAKAAKKIGGELGWAFTHWPGRWLAGPGKKTSVAFAL